MSETGNTRITTDFGDLHARIVEFARSNLRPKANAVVYLCARGLEKEAEERRQANLPHPQSTGISEQVSS